MGNRNREEEEKKNSLVQCFSGFFPVIYRWKTKLMKGVLGWCMTFRCHKKSLLNPHQILFQLLQSTLCSHIMLEVPDSSSEMFNTSWAWVLLQEKQFKGTGSENNLCSRWCGQHKLIVRKYWKLTKGNQNCSFV